MIKCEIPGCEDPAEYEYDAESNGTKVKFLACEHHKQLNEEAAATDSRLASFTKKQLTREDIETKLHNLIEEAWAAITHAFDDIEEGDLSITEAAQTVHEACTAYLNSVLPKPT